jgi:hypothetical protein
LRTVYSENKPHFGRDILATVAESAKKSYCGPRECLVVILFGLLIAVTHRPDALLRAQFFAEDGGIWFAQAYNSGVASLLSPYAGYYQALPRFLALLALGIPMHLAPFFMNAVGLLVELLPVYLLASKRTSNWGPIWMRLSLAALYLGVPNSHEIFATVTNAQWHLSPAVCILMFARPPVTRTARIFDIAIFVIFGLTGPFAVVLLPITFLFWLFRRYRWTLVPTTIFALTSFVQVRAFLLTGAQSRNIPPLGATFPMAIKLIGGRIILATLIGRNTLAHSEQF